MRNPLWFTIRRASRGPLYHNAQILMRGRVAGHGEWHFFVEEFWKVLPPTIFFAVGFDLVVLTRRILLNDYLVQFARFMVVTTTALVVGKAVLIAAAIPMLRWYDRKPSIIAIVFIRSSP